MPTQKPDEVIRAIVRVLIAYKRTSSAAALAMQVAGVESREKPLKPDYVARMLRGWDKMNPDVKLALHEKLGFDTNDEPITIWDSAKAMEAACKRQRSHGAAATSLLDLLNDWPARTKQNASLRYLPPTVLRVGQSDQVVRLRSGKHKFQLNHRGFRTNPRLILMDCDVPKAMFWSLLECRFAKIGDARIDARTQLKPETIIDIEIAPDQGDSELYAIVYEGDAPEDIGRFIPLDGSSNPHEITKPADACQILSDLAKRACVARCQYRV